MWTPGPFESKPSRAYYYLTDVDRSWSPDRQKEHLRDFNIPTLWNISIHEVYPGHFLHFRHLRQVDSKDLAMALKGVRPEVRRKIMDNMSSRAGENLVEEIEMLGAVRLKAVEEAQGAVVRVIRALEEAGQIVLTRSGDEYVD